MELKCEHCQTSPPRPRTGKRGPTPRYCAPCAVEIKREHMRGWHARGKQGRQERDCCICNQPIPDTRSASATTCSPECQQERVARYRKSYNVENRERRQAVERRRRYGIEPEHFRELVTSQRGGCAICLTVASELVVDHDHTTGAVRGALCPQCNVMLGMAADEPHVLEAAAAYLRRNRP